MDILVLRLIHVASGAFWVGAVFSFFLFVSPTARALGPEGQRFVAHLISRQRFSNAILVAGIITVAAGLLLLWRTSNGFDLDVMSRRPVLGFAIGGASAIVALAIASGYIVPRVRRVERITRLLQADGRPPTSDEEGELSRIAGEIQQAGTFVMATLAVAVAAMATARYWGVG
jgi:uncharacterized membrane protein